MKNKYSWHVYIFVQRLYTYQITVLCW